MPESRTPGLDVFTLARLVEEARSERGESDAECARLEADMLLIHDALVDSGWPGAVNADSIIERIRLQVSERDRLQRELATAEDPRVTPGMIERGAEAVRRLLGGEWRRYDAGAGLAELVLRAALEDSDA